jgi:hypothetical protein
MNKFNRQERIELYEILKELFQGCSSSIIVDGDDRNEDRWYFVVDMEKLMLRIDKLHKEEVDNLGKTGIK